jgi:glutathione S-transferase
MFTLYYARNTCALAPHIALEHSGAHYRAVRVDFAQNQQSSPEYLRLNSKGRVPTLVTPRGVLTETPAILQFICQTFPNSGLAPLDDPFELARMNAFNSYLCSTVHVAHAHGRRGSRWADDAAAIEQMKNKLPENMAACFDLIEREYLQGPWVLGENYSVSDMYLFTLAQWLEADGVDINRFPKVADHSLKMAQDPVVARVILAEQSAA